MRRGFNIRTKLLLVALLLLLIPWMSYIYVRDLKSFILSGQEDALSLTARAVATVLHDRPELFAKDSVILDESSEENEIYAFPLPNYININGDSSDWGEQANQAIEFNANELNGDTETSDKVKHALGYHGQFIYALFLVEDQQVLFRRKDVLRLDAADHIRLTLKSPGQSVQRYTLAASSEGRMSIYLVDKTWQKSITGEPNYNLAAELKLTPNGYTVELRVPRFMLSSDARINLTVADVDDRKNLDKTKLIATTPQTENEDLSKLLVQSPEIAKILKGLDRSDTRIWLIDNKKNVRAVVGNIFTDNQTKKQLIKPQNFPTTLNEFIQALSYFYHTGLQMVFGFIVDRPVLILSDHEKTPEQRNDEIINLALNGQITTDRRSSTDNQGTILMSSHPVYLGDSVLGAVIVEQSTNQVLQKQQDVLENVVSVTLLVLLTVITSLLIFASRLTYRIRKLRNAADNSIDFEGRIITQRIVAEAKSADEIGDLSRSMSNMLGRLSQYTNYLKGLPDTLAHEISNPLNVVNSSLHNMSQESPDIAQSIYMERAKNGIHRIGSILRNLTEAANLEQALQSETRETINLVKLIESYVDGYSSSHPGQRFDCKSQSPHLIVQVAPDYIAQLLDKLIDNAVDFAKKDTAIVIRTKKFEQFAQVDVINQGAYLPEGMSERIFEPLVSLGRTDAQKTRLGMGLYVVKLIIHFHGGTVQARNLTQSQGVIFSFTLPLKNSASLTISSNGSSNGKAPPTLY